MRWKSVPLFSSYVYKFFDRYIYIYGTLRYIEFSFALEKRVDGKVVEQHMTAVERLDIELLQQLLTTRLFGLATRLVYLPEVDSTNRVAMQIARKGSEEGVLVLTDSQVAGKGRQGRRWVDFSGCNAISSIVLHPLFPPYLLVMIASLAVVDAIAEVCGVTATIKWPNDVLIGDRKVSGILIETSRDQIGRMVAIMGIGVNVNTHVTAVSEIDTPAEEMMLTSIATTLETACGHRVSREAFIASLIRYIEAPYIVLQEEALAPTTHERTASRSLWERWRNRLSTLGRTVQVRQGDTIVDGIAEDVDDNGELLLRRHSGEQISITWGDIGYPTA